MQCPRCEGTALTMSERQNVEIDYCQKCRGIWLDRGELDKLIERAEQAESTEYANGSRSRGVMHNSRTESVNSDRYAENNGDRYAEHNAEHFSDRKRYGGRKKSWLGEIFD